jgi:midasin (ATPase involved in ribosome maturation)
METTTLNAERRTEKDNGSGDLQCIKPHPNFGVFLSMNPASGEISRAMRNRCVNIIATYQYRRGLRCWNVLGQDFKNNGQRRGC